MTKKIKTRQGVTEQIKRVWDDEEDKKDAGMLLKNIDDCHGKGKKNQYLFAV
ncbi:MAG: hypothetical protein IKJ28_04970 [Alphaproteobacteria bacterium]|nr:hypothetical protein [Alphaproteobacteria bacterium]